MVASFDLSQARRGRMRWNTPLSDQHAAALLELLGVAPEMSVLDLGCGWGELLLRAVAAGGTSARGVGLDTDAAAVERARGLAADRGLERQVEFLVRDNASWHDSSERVICVGAAHAWGGTVAALSALRERVRDGGRLLYGDGCWEEPPSEAASSLFGDQVLPLGDIIGHALRLGWRVVHLSTANQREWDEFESTWRQGLEEWLLANSADRRAEALRAELDDRLAEYVGVYRGVLGFCYLILSR